MKNMCIARRLKVSGIVQGVGFRPFVYQLANRYRLTGEVANTSAGVSILVQGRPEPIDSFCRDLARKSPPLALVTDISSEDEPCNDGIKTFTIAASGGAARKSTLISPDVSICKDCLKELFSPADRRYRYPFINCTNCGPRYTIIDDIPYDRPNTSMKHFALCDRCRAEYDDPADRRFHAQPNACAVCGPQVTLYDNHRRPVPDGDPIEKAAQLLRQGSILAVKGLGGFHLAADAGNEHAVSQLRKRKQREEKPFAVMSRDLASINDYAWISPEEATLLTSAKRPIVIVQKKQPNLLADSVAPRNRCFGVMLPYTPLHYLLLEGGFAALVMTSGNLSEEPICIDNADAFKRLASIADFFLVHNRDIYLRSDDSIVRQMAGCTRFLRRSRGYVPRPVFLNAKLSPILACGAELKSTVCLTRADSAFLSQHIGDLENTVTYEFFKLTIAHMQRILDVTPEIIAHDLHPDYLSTRYASQQHHLLRFQIQHHHAHIASCMAENRLEGPVIGLALDGTGYGTDGAIWGGEVLIAEPGRFERAAHLAYAPMPGSAAAIREPWRMAVSYLYQAFGQSFWELDLPLISQVGPKRVAFVVQMLEKGVNTPLTSSLGRLFDAVAALTGIRSKAAFEGQAAMELEMTAAEDAGAVYDFEWCSQVPHQIVLGPIIRGVVKDVRNGLDPSVISIKFHMTLVRLFCELCLQIRRENGLNRVVLSGGVFQNALFLTRLVRDLEMKNFQVFTHTQVPTNDGGICLGQALVAAALSKR